jgi:hypothetical protein
MQQCRRGRSGGCMQVPDCAADCATASAATIEMLLMLLSCTAAVLVDTSVWTQPNGKDKECCITTCHPSLLCLATPHDCTREAK